MDDPGLALQKALYQRLTDQLDVPVYDAVPMRTAYPYVTIDSEIILNATPVSGRTRANRLIYLSVWSNYPGQAEVKRIMASISAALDRHQLALASGRAFGLSVESMRTNREPDGVTYQGAIALRVHTQT